MITRCFDRWLDQYKSCWADKFQSKEQITEFVLHHHQHGTKIGKILNILKLDFSTEVAVYQPDFHEKLKIMIVQEGVVAFDAVKFIPRVGFTVDSTVIADAYKNIYSCMTDGAEDMGQFLSDKLLVEQGIRLATYHHKDHIVGRAIVNQFNQSYNGVYACNQTFGLQFEMALRELGFDGNRLTLSHLKLPHGWLPHMDEIGACEEFTQCRIASNEEWCFIVPNEEFCYEEALRRVRRIIPDFMGEIECKDDSDEWVSL